MQVTAVNDNAFQIIFGLSKFSAQHLGHWPGVHMELVHANLEVLQHSVPHQYWFCQGLCVVSAHSSVDCSGSSSDPATCNHVL